MIICLNSDSRNLRRLGMAFEDISKLQSTFKKLTRKGKLSEKDVKDAMREVRLTLPT